MRGATAMRAGFVMAAAGFVLIQQARAAEKPKAAMSEKEKAQKEPFPNDTGPDTVDVSKYPADVQKKYEAFKTCGQCHTLARPINSQLWKEDEWRRYVKRMMSKPGCEVKNGKAIFEFLTFDSKERKAKNKPAFKAHRVALLTKFKADHPDRYKLLFEDRSPQAEANRELPGW